MASPKGGSSPRRKAATGAQARPNPMLKRKLEESSTDRRRAVRSFSLEGDARDKFGYHPAAGGRPAPRALKTLMRKTKLGTKRQCQACGGRLYDLGKRPVVCPHCGAEVDLERLKQAQGARTSEPAAAALGAAAEAARAAAPAPRPTRAAAGRRRNGRPNRLRRSTRSAAGCAPASRKCSGCSATPASARRRWPSALAESALGRGRLRRLHRQGGAGDAVEGLRRRVDDSRADLSRQRGRRRRADLHAQPRRPRLARRR